jgi:PAS domain S-box-containing protein
MQGIIIEADRNVADVLMWKPEDLLGKPVDVVIPRELRAKHHAGFERVRTSGVMRPSDMAIQSMALTREGDKIPVLVSLMGWEDEKKNRFISAQIIHRRTFNMVVPGSGQHQAMRKPGHDDAESDSDNPAGYPPTDSGTFKKTKKAAPETPKDPNGM